MITITGKSASGKDTILKELLKLGYQPIVPYTTRPIREGEIDEKNYHYISKIDFRRKIKNGEFAEWRSYDTEFGTWYYGTAIKDLEEAAEDSVVILPPAAIHELKDILQNNLVVYLKVSDTTLRQRLAKRGDNPAEANRRLNSDALDFEGVESLADVIIYNEDEPLDKVVSIVVSAIEEHFPRICQTV